eukprot:scaffold1653_cov389-Prasinococcus_capsulatus_cf.AAC.3
MSKLAPARPGAHASNGTAPGCACPLQCFGYRLPAPPGARKPPRRGSARALVTRASEEKKERGGY